MHRSKIEFNIKMTQTMDKCRQTFLLMSVYVPLFGVIFYILKNFADPNGSFRLCGWQSFYSPWWSELTSNILSSKNVRFDRVKRFSWVPILRKEVLLIKSSSNSSMLSRTQYHGITWTTGWPSHTTGNHRSAQYYTRPWFPFHRAYNTYAWQTVRERGCQTRQQQQCSGPWANEAAALSRMWQSPATNYSIESAHS